MAAGLTYGGLLTFQVFDYSKPVLEWKWATWSDTNGIYVNGERLVQVEHDTLGEWFRVYNPEEWEQKFGPEGWNLMNRQSQRVRNIAEQFRSGRRVLLTVEMQAFLEGLFPAGYYRVTQRAKKFEVSQEEWFEREHMDEFFGGEPEDMADACSLPLLTTQPAFIQPVHFGPPRDSTPANSYFCKELKFLVVPVHATKPEVVEEYKEKMKCESYIPTVLLYSPRYKGKSKWFTDAVVLDGHHKLAAAVELGREISFILVEPRRQQELMDPPFHWANPTEELVRQFKQHVNDF